MAAGGHIVKIWLRYVLSRNFLNFVFILCVSVQNQKLQVPFDFGRDRIKNGRFAGFQSSVVTDFRGEKNYLGNGKR